MGRSFKLTNRPQKKKQPKEKEKEEIKVVYDHRPQIKTNPKLIAEMSKNMCVPTDLWDGKENMCRPGPYKMYKFRVGCCVGPTTKCICEYPYES